MTLTLDLKTWFIVNAYPLPESSVYVKFEPNRAKWRVYILFLFRADMTLTLNTHPLAKSILWFKYMYESHWTKGREYMHQTRIYHIILL